MTKVLILGSKEEYFIDNPNEILLDEKETGLCAFVSNGKLINAPINRLLVVCDIKKDSNSEKRILVKKND